MQEEEIQILEVTKTINDKSKKTGKPYTKKWLSVTLNGKPTEITAFTKPWLDCYLNVGETYRGDITKNQYGIQFEPTERIFDSEEKEQPPNEPPIEPKKPGAEPPKNMSEAITKAIYKTKAYTQDGTKEVEFVKPITLELRKEKSMRKMNILNNAVAKLCATIKISQPVGGDGTKQVIAFGDAHYNIDDLLKKYILEFQKYYEE